MGFMTGPLFYAANAMVFGSVASATSWGPFRRAILALAETYIGNLYLKAKHKKWLDMVNTFCTSRELLQDPWSEK